MVEAPKLPPAPEAAGAAVLAPAAGAVAVDVAPNGELLAGAAVVAAAEVDAEVASAPLLDVVLALGAKRLGAGLAASDAELLLAGLLRPAKGELAGG